MEYFRKKFSTKEDRLLLEIKVGKHVGIDIGFTRDKVDVWILLFNIINPAHHITRSGTLGSDVKIVSVNVLFST